MALYFYTSTPTQLLADFKKKIDQKHVTTWSYDAEGDFTHTVEQWVKKAWLRPKISEGRLSLNIMPPRGQSINKPVYGVYHGRFAESMLSHCDALFSRVEGTALAETPDNIG